MQHYRRFYYSVTPSPTACYNSFSNEIHSGGMMALDFQSDRLPFNRMVRAGVNSVLAALVANLIVRFILGMLLDLPGEFAPLQFGAIAFLTILGTSAGAVVFYLISRRSNNPIRIYWIVAMVVLVLSIIPNFVMMANPGLMPFPGGSALTFGVLIVFHVVAGLVSVWVLTRSAADPSK
jgi:hypothetical protein